VIGVVESGTKTGKIGTVAGAKSGGPSLYMIEPSALYWRYYGAATGIRAVLALIQTGTDVMDFRFFDSYIEKNPEDLFERLVDNIFDEHHGGRPQSLIRGINGSTESVLFGKITTIKYRVEDVTQVLLTNEDRYPPRLIDWCQEGDWRPYVGTVSKDLALVKRTLTLYGTRQQRPFGCALGIF